MRELIRCRRRAHDFYLCGQVRLIVHWVIAADEIGTAAINTIAPAAVPAAGAALIGHTSRRPTNASNKYTRGDRQHRGGH